MWCNLFEMNNTSKRLQLSKHHPNVDQNIFNTVRVAGQTDVTNVQSMVC